MSIKQQPILIYHEQKMKEEKDEMMVFLDSAVWHIPANHYIKGFWFDYCPRVLGNRELSEFIQLLQEGTYEVKKHSGKKIYAKGKLHTIIPPVQITKCNKHTFISFTHALKIAQPIKITRRSEFILHYPKCKYLVNNITLIVGVFIEKCK